jgi:hypothetical protein
VTTIAQLFDAFQAINASVKGVKFAPNSASTPNQLTSDKLPTAITWYADDDWCKVPETHFVIEVYVAPVGNTNPTLAMRDCLTLVQAFRDTYRALHEVSGLPMLREKGGGHRGFGSMGVHKTLVYGGQEFFGFSLRVPVFGLQ